MGMKRNNGIANTMGMKRRWMMPLALSFILCHLSFSPVGAQRQMTAVPLTDVQWTGGFWGDRFAVLSHTSVQSMWQTWQTKEGKGFNNFLIAAGEMQGEHHGPPFHDGDMYKWLEAVASVYAVTHDAELDAIMDRFISLVQKAQRPDGYIHTPVIIKERNTKRPTPDRPTPDRPTPDPSLVGRGVDSPAAEVGDGEGAWSGDASSGAKTNYSPPYKGGAGGGSSGGGSASAFSNRLNFETYNLGHLITAGIVHKRATGKTTLFDCAVRAADFLYDFCQRAPEELAGNAICPSHYMAVAELYRETGNTKYLDLLKKFIDIRGMVQNGTDDNQDRIPFRQQYRAMGHAVRANYLYAGVADLYLESGEEQLMKNLSAIWHDIVTRKMYVNGACGALYDGTSPDGTNYTPDSIQKVHQSYGRPYQLPHSTAHNETCANIGNMLFNWRLLQATGDAKYMDVVENCLYNSVLPGISLDGELYFYTNPLRLTDELPYKLRWPKERRKLISCFCCPPNTLRTLCQAQDYVYSLAPACVYVNMYGESRLQTTVEGVGPVTLSQHTDYPWDGYVELTVDGLKSRRGQLFTLALRQPSWTAQPVVSVNGQPVEATVEHGYMLINRQWKRGDKVTIDMPMTTTIIEANPLVEECRGQVAVMRGPIVYCLESQDLSGGIDIDDVVLPVSAQFRTVETTIGGSKMIALETEAYLRDEARWDGQLYRPAATVKKTVTVRLIPYYAWGNRGHGEMTVWLPTTY